MARRRPIFLRHVAIRDIVVEYGSLKIALVSFTGHGALDVETVQSVARGELLFGGGLAAFNIVYEHGVSDELGWVGSYIGEAGQFVNRVEWVGGLALGNKLHDLCLGAVDV